MTIVELRRFGLLFAAVFALLALAYRHAAVPGAGLAALSLATLFVAAFAPALLAAPARLWLRFGALLHGVVSPVVLGVMYVVLIVPAGILYRLFGRDPLRRKFDSAQPSYWIECPPRKRRLDDFRDPF